MSTQQSAARPEGRPARRVASVVIGIAVLVLKADAYAHLRSDGRVFVLVVLGLAAVAGLIHGRPVRMAVAAGAVVGVAIDSSSVWLRIGIGAAAVIALVAVSVAIGMLLMWLDERAPA